MTTCTSRTRRVLGRIKLWQGEQCVRTYEGHSDVVRSLALVSGIGFISASNDGTVRMWELGGSCLEVLHCGESFVYGVAVLPSGEWLTCSEDRTIKVWPAGGGDCTQSITHPASVWACCACANGDVAVGCADGNAYVWTRSEERGAPEAEQLAFKETVASVKKGSECGVILHNFGDAAEGDRISFYEEVPRKPHLYEELTEAELKLRAAQEDEG